MKMNARKTSWSTLMNRQITAGACAILALAASICTASAKPATTQITWYGHAAFKVTTPSGKVILLDPWITNPANKTGKQDLAAIKKADLILITHGHFDHVGDAADIAKRTGAQLVAVNELSEALVQFGNFPKAQATMATSGNMGGELSLLSGEVTVDFVPAVHSSGFAAPDTGEEHYAGNPVGFLVTVKGGPTIYDTGDTDMFSDMALIPKIRKVDVMLCCIGGKFTMGPALAAQAVKLVKPAMVVPMHYGTFPILAGTPTAFSADLKSDGVPSVMHAMRVHDSLSFAGHRAER